MAAFSTAMEYFPYVFHPITVVGASVLLLIHHEWTRQGADRAALRRRVGAFLGAGALALVPTVAYFALSGGGIMAATQGKSLRMDALVAGGLVIAAAATWYAWRRYEWGRLVPAAMAVMVANTVPYFAISAVWDISGHVIISLFPALYLTLVDRSFWPLLAVPLVMVPNRVVVGAHTWTQSLVGFALAVALTTGLFWYQTGGSMRAADVGGGSPLAAG